MAVYRLIFAPDVKVSEYAKGTDKYDECRGEIFEQFLKHSFLGTGWDTSELKPGMTDEDIRLAINLPKGSIENFRYMCSIAEGDLIWLIHKSNYYLFRVSDNKVGTTWLKDTFKEKEQWFLDRDISTCFTGEWCLVGNEIGVPGIIINNMGVGKTLREIKKAPELSMMTWNNHSGANHYDIGSLPNEQFWSILTNRQIEGLVLSYIQVKYNCIVNTESLKHSTALYECELIGSDGTRYLPQVKTGSSGNSEFPVEQFCIEINKIGEHTGNKTVPVLFYENEDYGTYESPTLIKISKEDLIGFINEYPQFISIGVINAHRMVIE